MSYPILILISALVVASIAILVTRYWSRWRCFTQHWKRSRSMKMEKVKSAVAFVLFGVVFWMPVILMMWRG